jgi:PAS domain S-box-containing protein
MITPALTQSPGRGKRAADGGEQAIALALHRRSRFFVQAAAAWAFALGGVALIGWSLKSELLKSIVPGSSPLKPNIAAGLLVCGAVLALLAQEKIENWLRRAIGLVSLAVILVAMATLGEHFFGWNLGIDRWLVHDSTPSMGFANPGRMMPTTAFCFLIMGIALLAEAQLIPQRFRFPLVAGLSAALVMIGVLALGGFSLEKLIGPRWNLMGMSLSGLTAAVGFMILGSGILALLQGEGALSWSLNALTTMGFAVGIFLTVLTTASAFTFGKEMLETNNWVTHRQEVVKKIQEVMTDIVELASRERVYIITGDEQLLQERELTKTETRKGLSTLRNLTADNPNQQRRLDQLEPLLAQRIDWEEQLIALRRSAGLAEAAERVAQGPGLRLSDNLVQVLKEAQAEEYALLSSDRQRAERASTTTFLLLPMGVFVTLGVLSLSLFFLNSGVSEQKRAEGALRESEAQLHTIVENLDEGVVLSALDGRLLQWNPAALKLHGYSSSDQDYRLFPELVDTFALSTLEGASVPVEQWPLARILRGEKVRELELRIRRIGSDWQRILSYGGTLVHDANKHPLMAIVTAADITRRKAVEAEILQLNVELEERVIQRTAELEAANKELEAFSYSVSHDLRAPLRAVDGFSQAVLEDFGEQLPEQARDYLQTIRGGAQRMGALIDDLLTFSRLSRLPLNKRPMNTASLVRDALDELGFPLDGRKIEMRIADLPECLGDAALLKQVWLNLLSNALKYTKQRESAVIEVDFLPENGETIYFVRDNGTGFDMRYADKLFGVFQRLHRAEDFEGTGVGLAIVQRIVHRHGGRVWAEAAEGKGATFYFTLEGNSNV